MYIKQYLQMALLKLSPVARELFTPPLFALQTSPPARGGDRCSFYPPLAGGSKPQGFGEEFFSINLVTAHLLRVSCATNLSLKHSLTNKMEA